MKKAVFAILVALILLLPVFPGLAQADENACWGQASAVFAQTGEMGEHASQQATPRVGLRNLARLLYAEGVIAEDSMAALGQFVAEAYGLEIDACLP